MTRKSKPRNPARQRAAARAARAAVTPRNVVLAGLGAAVIARRTAAAALDGLAAGAADMQARGAELACAASGRASSLARRATTSLAPLRRQAESFAREAEREFEATVAPVLARFGLVEAPARRRPRATPRKAASARKPVRKSARRA